MHKFVYPRDYLNIRGNVKQCWEVHKKLMKRRGLPYVDYNAFYSRLNRSHWDLYKAIHCPLDKSKLEWHELLKVWCRTQRFRFIYLFKRNDRGWRSERF